MVPSLYLMVAPFNLQPRSHSPYSITIKENISGLSKNNLFDSNRQLNDSRRFFFQLNPVQASRKLVTIKENIFAFLLDFTHPTKQRYHTLDVSKNKKEMPTAPGIPRRSPIQVLTRPNVA